MDCQKNIIRFGTKSARLFKKEKSAQVVIGDKLPKEDS